MPPFDLLFIHESPLRFHHAKLLHKAPGNSRKQPCWAGQTTRPTSPFCRCLPTFLMAANSSRKPSNSSNRELEKSEAKEDNESNESNECTSLLKGLPWPCGISGPRMYVLSETSSETITNKWELPNCELCKLSFCRKGVPSCDCSSRIFAVCFLSYHLSSSHDSL